MERRGALKKMSVHVGPNMTPMVDVVMCILIFFMLGSSLAAPELFLKNNTAAVEKGGLGTITGDTKLPDVRMNIKLARQGDETWVSAFNSPLMKMSKVGTTDQSDNEKVFAVLTEKRKSISDEVQVLIVPESHTPYQDVITLYDFCTKLQFKQVAFYPAKD
jgi:biopolymer transport protein ExbD